MALYTAGAAAILTPAQVAELVVRPVIEQAVSARFDRDPDRHHDLRVPIVLTDPTGELRG